MQNRMFQNTCNQFKNDINRIIGIIDEAGFVIACSDESKVGIYKENIMQIFESTADEKMIDGYCVRKIKSYNKTEYVVFCEGTDDIAKGYCAILGTHFVTVKQYYDEKFDRNSFVKNVILDNVLPSDVIYRTKELHLSIECPRVVLLVRTYKQSEVSIVDILKGIFPDKEHDFVVRIDDNDVAIIKELRSETDDAYTYARNIDDAISAEAMVKCSVGISTVANTIQELARAYRESRIALEVGKVFDTEKTIVSYDNLGIGRLIYQLPTTLCELFLNEVLKKESIDVLDSETIYTVQKFFENNLNVSETSRKLFVHRNTLVYRLDKIKKITGLDLREFDDAIIFKFAMMVSKYLTNSPTKM